LDLDFSVRGSYQNDLDQIAIEIKMNRSSVSTLLAWSDDIRYTASFSKHGISFALAEQLTALRIMPSWSHITKGS
jgi:hypothetical protein